jgi:hypothetical protein
MSFRVPKVGYMKGVFALTLSLLFVLVGCIDTRTANVDYGPEADPQAIMTALDTPVANMKAANMKVGEFVAMETSQDVALGQSVNIIGDTGATITDRAEDNDRVVFQGVLKQLTLQNDGTYSKVSREGEILCASKTACACGECSTTDQASKSQAFIGVKAEPIIPSMEKKTLATGQQLMAKSVQNLSYQDPTKLVSQAVAQAQPTYHRFTTWKTLENPPAEVAAQPNCLGIANCKINVYHVMFDEIYWDTPRGSKVHVEAAVSPDVPYLSRNLSTCQSLLVNVGTDGSNILLKQCTNVFSFRFQAE